MARPKKEGLEYFPHDTDASNDEKIESLRLLYGNDGYAFYFILLERIYRTNTAELDISDAETIQILSRKVSVTQEKFMQMLDTALKRNCFDKQIYDEHKILTSNGIKKRAGIVVEKRLKMRERYHSDKEIISDAETREEIQQKPDKVKQSKVKKSKVYKYNVQQIEFAELLLKKIRENQSNFKEPVLESWADTFRLIMEVDKRDAKDIQDIIIWCQKSSFWHRNILSADKLRKQFDRLQLEMNGDQKKPKGGGKPSGTHQSSYETDYSKYDFSGQGDL